MICVLQNTSGSSFSRQRRETECRVLFIHRRPVIPAVPSLESNGSPEFPSLLCEHAQVFDHDGWTEDSPIALVLLPSASHKVVGTRDIGIFRGSILGLFSRFIQLRTPVTGFTRGFHFQSACEALIGKDLHLQGDYILFREYSFQSSGFGLFSTRCTFALEQGVHPGKTGGNCAYFQLSRSFGRRLCFLCKEFYPDP